MIAMNPTDKTEKAFKNQNTLKDIAIVAAIAASILIIPLAVSIFSKEMNWSVMDFIIVWILLFSAGITYRLVTRKKKTASYRGAIALAALTGLFMMWVNLGVGIFGSGPNPVNLLYAVVLTVGLFGSIMSRFKPHGMALTLYSMAAANILLAVFALIYNSYVPTEENVMQIVMINFFFIVMWTSSGLLFRNAEIESKS
jgi:hypothetical protein